MSRSASPLAPGRTASWGSGAASLDVGSGNGAFAQLIAEQHAPSSPVGIDPSEALLDYAFRLAVMPLVIFFAVVPANGVAEMVQVKEGSMALDT